MKTKKRGRPVGSKNKNKKIVLEIEKKERRLILTPREDGIAISGAEDFSPIELIGMVTYILARYLK